MNPKGKAVAIGDGESFFSRSQCRNFFGVEHGTCDLFQIRQGRVLRQGSSLSKDESGILLAKNSTPVAPDQSLLGKNFLKWDGKQWLPEPKPTTAQECAALGDLDHHSQTERVHELRKLFDDLTSGSEKWRVEQDPETLAKRVVAIPPEEGIAAEADQELAVFDAQVASLKDRMATAMLMGDDATVDQLRAEYKALMAN